MTSNSQLTTVDTSLYTSGINGLVEFMKGKTKLVLHKETGELLKTLIKFTPRSSSKKIAASISNKFATIASFQVENKKAARAIVKNGIKWIHHDSNFLWGVAPESDMTGATVDELKKLNYALSASGKSEIKDFKKPRKGGQRVLIFRTILTKSSTVKKLIAAKSKNAGRLPAGWLAGWDKLSPKGGNMPPNLVMRHKSGCRGTFVDASGNWVQPYFQISNTAEGVGSKRNRVKAIAAFALDLRGKAMAKNLRVMIKGKRRVKDYA